MNKILIKGIDRIPTTASYLFKHDGKWITARQLVSSTQEEWTTHKSNRTKHTILNNPIRWSEAEAEFEGDIAVPIPMSEYMLTTNGIVIKDTKVIEQVNGVYNLVVGGQEKQLKMADLLYHAFIDVYYNPTTAAAKGSTLEDLRLEGEEPLEPKPTPESIDGLSPAAAEFKKKVETFVKENNMYEYYAGLHTPESSKHKHAIEKLYNGGTITDWEKYVD